MSLKDVVTFYTYPETSPNPESDGVDTSLLEHISPIEWENVVLYGEYVIDRNWIR